MATRENGNRNEETYQDGNERGAEGDGAEATKCAVRIWVSWSSLPHDNSFNKWCSFVHAADMLIVW